MFSSFYEKLLLKMVNICQEISKKLSYVRTEVGGSVGGVKSVLTRTGWVGWSKMR